MGRSSEGLHRGGKKSQERGKKRLHIEYEHACTSYKAPMTYDEVHKSRQGDEWNKDIQAEMKALQEKNTWTDQAHRPGQNVIRTK